MDNMKCPVCGSEKIMQDLGLSAQGGGSLVVIVQGNPDALIFKDTKLGTLQATVCGDCGNVSLSIEKPKELWETYTRVNS